MLLSPSEVREIGLRIMGVRLGRKNHKRLQLEFHKHYGSSPLDIADMWFDLCNQKDELSTKEKSEKGFKRFLSAHYWLWCGPKNASLVASRFGMCLDYCQGKQIWKWIGRCAILMEKKIVWDASLDAEDTEMFCISMDGVDFPMWERQHPLYPVDSKACSHKFKGCGAKYLIALSTFWSKCVFISGPFRGGMSDIDMTRESGLMDKLQQNGKVCIADRGFWSKSAEEKKHFALPDYMDSKELNNFKSRTRLRQETYNRRLKHFEALSKTFKHGFVKHGIALRAVATIVQYQMDNGSPIYCV
jgi:hypothetical protein